MAESENGNGKPIVVRNWHVFILLAIQLLALAAAYGRISERLDQTVNQLNKIDARSVVSETEFDQWRTEFMNRVSRLEDQIERMRTAINVR